MEKDEIFELAERYVEATGRSVFLTGKAGTGKTTFLRHITQTTTKRFVVLAPTGVAAIIGSNIQFSHAGFEANILTNYVGKQYLDNTSNHNAMLDDYCVSNLRLAYTLNCPPVLGGRAQRAEGVNSSLHTPHSSFFIKSISFHILLNNLFNTRYESNGGVYGYFEGADANGNYLPENQKHTPWYYAQAGINLHAGFTINF